VLEHVENPIAAVNEMYRALKQGGYCLAYVPFLYYYHAEKGYYKDYWRFTKDCIPLLFKDFSRIEVCSVRGAIETWAYISPFGKVPFIRYMARSFDKLLKKTSSNQISGFYIFCVK